MKLFCLGSNPELTSNIAKSLGVEINKVNVARFPDGEWFIEFQENCRGEDCFLVQSLYPNSSDEIIKLLLAADTLKRASAGRVCAVVPYFAYMRQDRKLKPRVPISFKTLANLLRAAGVDRVLTMDLHRGQLAGFFDIPVDNLLPHPTVIPYLKNSIDLEECVIVSPDAGGVERAKSFLDGLGVNNELAIIYKYRTDQGIFNFGMVGNVKGKTALVVDDIIDTCGTIKQAFELLLKNGANKVLAFATHGVFSNPALKTINDLPKNSISTTNTISLKDDIKQAVNILDVAPLFAEAIKRIHTNASVSELFKW